jgi:hypothetical protein
MLYIPILKHISQTTSALSFRKESEEDLTNLEQIHFRALHSRGVIDLPRASVPLHFRHPNTSYLSATTKCSCEVFVFK